jgi:catechol 2,3-dioxygenase-like lactoylglutathione lyase family enzyme
LDDFDFEIETLSLETAATASTGLEAFYGDRLGLGTAVRADGTVEVAVGDATLVLRPAGDRPYHHFALLVPGDRLEAAREWVTAATELLAGERGPLFEFGSWSARALYFTDPAGNIVELVSHRGIGESGRGGPFSAAELRGISEAGLVVADPAAAARVLDDAGIPVWDGDPDAGIAFAGRQGHTLVLSSADRNWMPTSRRSIPFRTETIVRAGGRLMIVSGDRCGRLEVTGAN